MIPVKQFTDSTPMPFGKFIGKAMIDVPAHYLLYIYDNNYDMPEGVKQYIMENLEALKKEAGRK
jgi:uncharacterized protein (DUF3820 family)